MPTAYRTSGFKNPTQDHQAFRDWVRRLEEANDRSYLETKVSTSLGTTHIWKLDAKSDAGPPLVIFPGARTSSLIWDLDRGLDQLAECTLYLVETNGLPNLSDGATPNIKGLGWGEWAAEVLTGLGLEQAYVAGASFGGLIAMKLALVAPSKVKAAFLLDPGCLAPFAMTRKNLVANLKPVLKPTEKNVRDFLETAVFHAPTHTLSAPAMGLLVEYQLLALTRYRDKTQKPYAMGKALAEVQVPTYLLHGQADILFPYQKSVAIAEKYLPLEGVQLFPHVGHGIECYPPALQQMQEQVLR